MTYEHERGIIGMLGGIEDRHLIDLSDYKKELKEVYAKAKAWQTLKDTMLEDYPTVDHEADVSNGDGERGVLATYEKLLKVMDELDRTHEFSNLLDDMNREDK